jgi:hypothetical protein
MKTTFDEATGLKPHPAIIPTDTVRASTQAAHFIRQAVLYSEARAGRHKRQPVHHLLRQESGHLYG